MQRLIKFRVWDGNQFDYDCTLETFIEDKCFSINDIFKPHDDPECFCIQQFTNLKDRNGKEIYEGDILFVYKVFGGAWDSFHGLVEFKNGRWEVGNENIKISKSLDFIDHECGKSKIIGNIFESPKLLSK